jgi:hypothetical protein
MPSRGESAALRAGFAVEYYTAAEVGVLLRITPRAVGLRRAAGRLRGVPRPGGARGYIYARAEIDRIAGQLPAVTLTCPGCGVRVDAAGDGGLPQHRDPVTGRACDGREHGTARRFAPPGPRSSQ